MLQADWRAGQASRFRRPVARKPNRRWQGATPVNRQLLSIFCKTWHIILCSTLRSVTPSRRKHKHRRTGNQLFALLSQVKKFTSDPVND